jgi:hypothetical protein
MMMAVESLGGWRFGKKETTTTQKRSSSNSKNFLDSNCSRFDSFRMKNEIFFLFLRLNTSALGVEKVPRIGAKKATRRN